MGKIFTVLFFISCALGVGSVFTSAHANEWVSASKVKFLLKQQRRKGYIAVSASCRNNPGSPNRMNPQIKLIWKVNTAEKQWTFLYDRNYDWAPGLWPGQEKSWRRISRNVFSAGPAALKFSCSLWHHKTKKIGEDNSHGEQHRLSRL